MVPKTIDFQVTAPQMTKVEVYYDALADHLRDHEHG